MKKNVLAILLTVCLLVTLSACGKKDVQETFPETEAMETTQTLPAETEAAAETTTETRGPIGLGRVPADSAVTVTEPDAPAETETAAEESTAPSETEPAENASGNNEAETKPEQQTQQTEPLPPAEPVPESGGDWGGGRA